MNKNETLHYLDQLGIKYEIVEHQAVYNMAEMEKIALHILKQMLKICL